MERGKAPTEHIRFGVFEVDLCAGELRRNGTKLKLQEQSFQILQALLENAGGVVTREELRERIWPADTFVDFDHGLYSAMTKLREALGDSPRNPRFIETVPRRGYRFIAGIETVGRDSRPILGRRRNLWVGAALVLAILGGLIWRLRLRGHSTAGPGAPKVLAVVEIENISQDHSLDWLGDGVEDLLTTDLAQAKGLDVISAERVRELVERRIKPGENLPVSQAQRVAKEAGADVFVSGALLKVGRGIRLDLRVEETATGKILLADKVEGENPQAVFSMVDEAASRIVSQFLPATAVAANSAASLTSNLDALHAYERGIGYFNRVLMPEAVGSFRRATELDPQFAMAYYYLSITGLSSGTPQRQVLAQAAQLAERVPLPEQQKLLIRTAQLAGDGREADAIQMLQTVVDEFPRDVELQYRLGRGLDSESKIQEATAVFKKLLQADPGYPMAYLGLAYDYALQGDRARSLASLDQYAALLPPDDPNPIGTRGDVYAISGQFDQAIAWYQKDRNTNPGFMPLYIPLSISLAYLHEGKALHAVAMARRTYTKATGLDRALAASVLGDIAVGRGQLDRAADRYAEAARLQLQDRPLGAHASLMKAAEIYFEQQKPQAALAFARRQPQPWAAGVRAMAQLLLKNNAAAEKEFAAERAAAAPLAGEYRVDTLIARQRLLAASYGGRWQQVISGSSGVPPNTDLILRLNLGRAYLQAGLLPQAEQELRFVLLWDRMWASMELIIADSHLSAVLAQFYLGKVLEQEGKRADAVHAYRAFLRQIEAPDARLPQIAEARAALKRLS